MAKKQVKKGKVCKKGFTIIEVVLVLAIAGLIFLMVFIALPALQRGQRNTQRQDDLSRFLTAVTEFQSNNSGRLPFNDDGTVAGSFVHRYIDRRCEDLLNNNGAEPDCTDADQFTDPDGTTYQFVQGAQVDGVVADVGGNDNFDHGIYFLVGFVCDTFEGTVRKGTGDRNVALLFTLEGGQITCNDNQ